MNSDINTLHTEPIFLLPTVNYLPLLHWILNYIFPPIATLFYILLRNYLNKSVLFMAKQISWKLKTWNAYTHSKVNSQMCLFIYIKLTTLRISPEICDDGKSRRTHLDKSRVHAKKCQRHHNTFLFTHVQSWRSVIQIKSCSWEVNHTGIRKMFL
jgi:hypothetical protein